MLIDQQVILPAAEHWRVDASRLAEVRVPPTLTGVLQARLDALSAWERVVLQRASVIGREFWEGALAEFSRAADTRGEAGEGDTSAALESLRRKELVYRRESSTFTGTREYIFKHAILRSVTYENVLKRDRRRLHERPPGGSSVGAAGAATSTPPSSPNTTSARAKRRARRSGTGARATGARLLRARSGHWLLPKGARLHA